MKWIRVLIYANKYMLLDIKNPPFFFLVETSSIHQPRVERILQELRLSNEGTTTSVLHLSNLEGENNFMMMFKS